MRCEVCQTIERLHLDDPKSAHDLFVCTCRQKVLQMTPRRPQLTLLSPFFEWMRKSVA
jgi:hypothetical protein